MPIAFYLDHNMHRAIAYELRRRSVDVITAYEDNAAELSDEKLLDRATTLNRVIVTGDEDFLRLAAVLQ